MSKPVRKAVFPVAGLGTRSLPATKAVPKEMLTVVDKPVLQYAVEEAIEAGIEVFVFVTSRGKTALEDHFDQHFELYETLRRRGKEAQLKQSQDAELPVGKYLFVRQPVPLGLGHAVWCAKEAIGDEPCAVLLPDEVFRHTPNVLSQMLKAYGERGGNLVAVREVPQVDTAKYGILDVEADDGTVATMKGMVEKPKPEEAPSNLSIVGRYVLQPEIFAAIEKQGPGAGNEIQLTDAMAQLIGHQPFAGVRFEGDRFDCGDKAGFVTANIAFALGRDDLAPKVREEIARYL